LESLKSALFIDSKVFQIPLVSESIKSALFRDSKEVDIYVVEPQHILYENI
jgi:hypothetical protein